MMKYKAITLVLFCIIYLCGVSANAQHVWKRSYGNFRVSSFTMTLEEKYVMVGDYYDSMVTYCNIMQTDADGFSEWDTVFMYPVWSDWDWCIESTADSGYIIAKVGLDGWGYFMKFDKKNSLEWDSHITNDTVEGLRFISSIIPTDGGYVAIGSAIDYQIGDRAYVLKIDPQGKYIWDRSYAGHGWGIVNGFDFGYYFLCDNYGTELLRLDDSGAKLWANHYNMSSCYPQSLIRTHDSCFVFSGKNGGDLAFKKVDQDGVEVWEKSYNCPHFYNTSMWETFDNGIITSNYKESANYDYTLLLRMDDQGDSLWTISPAPRLKPSKIVQSSDSQYVFHANNHWPVAYLYKTDSIGDIITGIRQKADVTGIQTKCYPNPFTNSTTIEYELTEPYHIQLTIYNAIGETIYKAEDCLMPQGMHTLIWSPESLPEGMYYGVLRSGEELSVIKMIKQ